MRLDLRLDDAPLFPNSHPVWVPPVDATVESDGYPGPPLSSMSGDISHRSKREEMIAQDWSVFSQLTDCGRIYVVVLQVFC